MLEDRLFAAMKPDAIFAYHTAPLEVGQVGTRSGPLLAGRDELRVRLTGEGDLSGIAGEAVEIIRATSTVEPSHATAGCASTVAAPTSLIGALHAPPTAQRR